MHWISNRKTFTFASSCKTKWFRMAEEKEYGRGGTQFSFGVVHQWCFLLVCDFMLLIWD